MINRIARVCGQLILTVGAVVGACCLLLTIGGTLFGVRPLIFRSGSMSPAITAGDLAIARMVDADRLKIGDVVSVPVGDIRVAHRITEIIDHGSTATLQLKGDANRQPDAHSFQVARAEKIMFAVPELGRAIAWLSRTPGVFVLAGYATLMLALVLRRRPNTGHGDHDRRRSAKPRRTMPRVRPRLLRFRTIVTAASLAVLTALHTTPSWATWNDAARVTTPSNAITTHTVPATKISCSGLNLLGVKLSWTPVATATGYTLHYGSGGKSVLDFLAGTTSYTYTLALGLNASAWVEVHENYGSTTWTSRPSNTVTYIAVAAVICG